MVRLINNTKIPTRFRGGLHPLRVLGKQAERAQHQLRAGKRVWLAAFLQGFTAVLIQQGELQVEAPQHLYQPLVQQRFRDHDQGPAYQSADPLLLQYQSRFDGFSQSYLVGQHDARSVAAGHFVRNIKLVGNQLGPCTA